MKTIAAILLICAMAQPGLAREMHPTIKLVAVLTVMAKLCPIAIDEDKSIEAVLAVHNGPPPPGYRAMAHRAAVRYLTMSKKEQFEACEQAWVEAEELGIAK
jgi:hypothetical protein